MAGDHRYAGFLQRQRWRFTGRYRRSIWTPAALCIAIMVVGNHFVSGWKAGFAVDLCAVVAYFVGSAYLRRRFRNVS